MNICTCVVPSRHGGTLNSRSAASPLVSLAEGEERWEAPDLPQDICPQNWGEAERISSVRCNHSKPSAVSAAEKAFCVTEWNPQLLCNGIFDHDLEKNLQLENLPNVMKNLKLVRGLHLSLGHLDVWEIGKKYST
ncbi:uncharacterized protein TNCV_2494071 [Trichonephila clavipes]|uniref:Uncharacterized protein n=1 Tax=Trichonephila clavipes TaxID=2585209 RepID=A0A8X6UZW4_TRICX|nr:uncharacterized protein TNCV_2494071 [Trichonephila clavipes]